MSILVFFVVLFLLILVHEWGHFIVAKKSGIRVDEFGIGFPPKALGYTPKGSETEYTLNWLPIGGFVRIFGEDPDDESLNGPDKERSFVHKPKYIQAAVLVAGVLMNVLFAYGLYVAAFTMGILTQVDESTTGNIRDHQVVVYEVLEGSPAEAAGIEVGDLVVGIEGVDVGERLTSDDISGTVAESSGSAVVLSINRNGEVVREEVVPERNASEALGEAYAIGIAMGDVAIVSYPLHESLVVAAVHTYSMLTQVVVGLGTFFAQAFTLSADLSQVAGPVGIVSLVGDASALGFVYLISFTAFISLNLAVINMIPFPALDGGRLLFVGIEAIKGSPINPKIANVANYVGFTLLIGLMLLVTISDVVKLVG